MQLIESILADAASIAAVRRDIHAHPELCFEELRTSDVIAKQLTDWGIPVHRGLGKTGVVGIIKNGSSSRAVGLRADIDALPMTEHNHFPHASVHPGKMHACGHDGHTAILLAAAHHLAHDVAFDGTLHLIFQPAEEAEGGAQAMTELLGRPHLPTAVLAEFDELAIGALWALRRAGLQVPRDVSVIGIDDMDMARFVDLTTVAQDVVAQGRYAAVQLIRLLTGEAGPEQRARDDERLATVEAALAALPPRRATAVRLHLAGFTPAESGRVLGLSVDAIRKLVERGLDELKARLAGRDIEDE